MENIVGQQTKETVLNNFLWRLFNCFFFVFVVTSAQGSFYIPYCVDGVLLSFTGILYAIFVPRAFLIIKLKNFIFLFCLILLTVVVNFQYANLGKWYLKIILIVNLFLLLGLRNIYKKNLIENCSKALALCLIVSFATWCLVKLGVSLPYKVVVDDEETLEQTLYIFKDYFFFREFFYEYFNRYEFVRFQAFFLEPSTLGKVCLCFFIANNFNMQKWYVVVFLVMLVVSFSLATYLVLSVALIIKIFLDKKIGKFFILFCSVFVILLTTYYTFPNDSPIHIHIFDRLFQDDKVELKYNRSSSEFDDFFYDVFLKSKYTLIGDREYMKSQQRVPSVDYKRFLVASGFIGAASMLLFLVCCFCLFRSTNSCVMICSYFILFLASCHIWDYFVYIGTLTLSLNIEKRKKAI